MTWGRHADRDYPQGCAASAAVLLGIPVAIIAVIIILAWAGVL